VRRFLTRSGWVVFLAALLVHGAFVVTVVNRVPGPDKEVPPLPPLLWIFNDAVHRLGPGADFFALYHAAVEMERGGDIYTWNPDGVTPFFYGYRYLPAFVQAAGPFFRLFGPWEAYLIWLHLLVGLVVLDLFLVRRLFGNGPHLPWLMALWLVYTPLWLELYMGQFTFLAASLVMAAGTLLATGKPRGALVAWFASAAVKMFTLVLLPMWWRLRLFVPALAVVGVLSLVNLPAFVRHPGYWSAFVFQNVGEAPFNALHSGNFGFVYFLRLVGWEGLGLDPTLWFPYVSRFQIAFLAIATLAVALARRPPALAMIAFLVLAHQLSYFHVWEHHYTLLLPLGTFLLFLLRGRRAPTAVTAAAMVLLAIPTPLALWDIRDPGLWDPTTGWPVLQRIALPASKALPALALFGVSGFLCLEGGVSWPWRGRIESASPGGPPEKAAGGGDQPPGLSGLGSARPVAFRCDSAN